MSCFVLISYKHYKAYLSFQAPSKTKLEIRVSQNLVKLRLRAKKMRKKREKNV